jgi:hypothetical protein
MLVLYIIHMKEMYALITCDNNQNKYRLVVKLIVFRLKSTINTKADLIFIENIFTIFCFKCKNFFLLDDYRMNNPTHIFSSSIDKRNEI